MSEISNLYTYLFTQFKIFDFISLPARDVYAQRGRISPVGSF